MDYSCVLCYNKFAVKYKSSEFGDELSLSYRKTSENASASFSLRMRYS